MALRIQFRRDTAANWTSVNPVLAEGELGLELDTDKFKIGDGTSDWGSLSYSSLPSTALTVELFAAKGDIIVANTPSTATRLGVGTDGQVLIANSSSALGMEWGTVSSLTEDDVIALSIALGG